jgi:SNF2 family DNA or RNA helicase
VLNVVAWRGSGRALSDVDVADARRSVCHVVGCRLHLRGSQDSARLQLAEVFHSLTSQTSVKQMEVRDDTTYERRMRQQEGQAEPDAGHRVILTDLPTIALQNLVCMVNARDLAALSGVCSMFQHMAYEVVPGLNLVLYEHQRRGLKWMLRRESALASRHSDVPHPFVFPSTTSNQKGAAADAKTTVIDLVDYKLAKRAHTVVQDTRGGLFCDEPGLGKTITVLALILRTQGQRSNLRHTLESADLTASHGSGSSSGIALRSSQSQTRGRAVATSELVRSRASLIVVPDPLVEHWRYQIAMHVAPGALRVYVDKDEKNELPRNSKLARYDIVVTSFSRLTREWKFHRPASALETRMPDRYGFEDSSQRYADGQARGEVSSLLTVNWIRVIVDEGHKLGGQTPTNLMMMARLISAERRWVMTGTPTPNTLQSADLRHMHGLLVFLRNLPYGHPDGKAWNKAIARPFEQNERIAFYRLQHLLSRIMLRHTKESIQEILPEPVRQVVMLDPTPDEYEEYNAVAASVRANLVLSYMDPHEPGSKHFDSLMNPINRSSALIVVRNLRASTCTGAKMRVLLTQKSTSETLTMLTTKFKVDADLVRQAAEYMRRVVVPGLKTQCECCRRMLQILMLIPCGHLCCADCLEDTIVKDGYTCFQCHKQYDPEDLQRLQPGLEYSRVEDEEEAEDQPNNRGRGRRGGRARQGQQQTAGRPQNQQGGGQRQNRNQNGQHENGQRGAAPAPRPFIPIDLARDFDAIHASKAFYAVARIRELRDEFARGNSAPPSASDKPGKTPILAHRRRPRYVKAIIFSQFKEHIWKIRIAFAQQGVKTANFIAGLKPELRMKELMRFRNDPSISVLLLTEIGSHGLDLSFVTHVFLMEEIWDKSLEQQVVSRAHRMGASQSVVVEQLVMRNSIETLMQTMNERGLDAIREEEEEKEQQLLLSYFRAGISSSVAAASPASFPPASPARRPHTGTGSMFGKSSKKRKRQASGEASSHKDKDGKTSALQQRIHYVLSNLRLLDGSVCAEPGQVRFMVLNNNHKIIRRGIHMMKGPTERAVTSSVEFTEASAATYQGSAPKRATAQSPASRAQSRPMLTASPAMPSARVAERSSRMPQRRPSVPEVIVIDSSSSEADDAEESDASGSDHNEADVMELYSSSSSSSSSSDDDDTTIANMLKKAQQLMVKRQRRIVTSSDEDEETKAEPMLQSHANQQLAEAPAVSLMVPHGSPIPGVVITKVEPQQPSSQGQQVSVSATTFSDVHRSPSPDIVMTETDPEPSPAQEQRAEPPETTAEVGCSLSHDAITTENQVRQQHPMEQTSEPTTTSEVGCSSSHDAITMETEPQPSPAQEDYARSPAMMTEAGCTSSPDFIMMETEAQPLPGTEQQAESPETLSSEDHRSPSRDVAVAEPETQPSPAKRQRTEAPATTPNMVVTEVTRIAGRAVTVVTIDSDDDDDDMDFGFEIVQSAGTGSDTAPAVMRQDTPEHIAKMVRLAKTVRFDVSALEVKDGVAASVVAASVAGTKTRKTVRFSEVDIIHPIVSIAAATAATAATALSVDDEDTETESE